MNATIPSLLRLSPPAWDTAGVRPDNLAGLEALGFTFMVNHGLGHEERGQATAADLARAAATPA